MCGIAGYIAVNTTDANTIGSYLKNMGAALSHRGPDDNGVWIDNNIGVGLVHSRLSIVDLSPAGHQPMLSSTGRYVLSFNGEIYNHLEIRRELDSLLTGIVWRGHSDTETLLAAIENWGLNDALTRCVGMFAVALWDTAASKLYLARDRFGEKPLYYGWVGADDAKDFVFGSELKAIKTLPGFGNPICRQSLMQYLQFMYVPAPRSIYEGIYKLEPGCLLVVDISSGVQPNSLVNNRISVHLERWWLLAETVENGMNSQFTDEKVALSTLDGALSLAVKQQSLADVPLGAFLSGGIDSSLITALMQKQSTKPVKTFTIGFEETGFDESPFAAAVAKHLGTDHHEMFVTSKESLAVIPELHNIYDEPFADSSQIPTFLVSKIAKEKVTVALSGDAGDELFGGYNRYFWGPSIWSKVGWLPYPLRLSLAKAISLVPVTGWDAFGRVFKEFINSSGGIARLGEKAHKLAYRLSTVRNIDDLYFSLVTEWEKPERVVVGNSNSFNVPTESLAETMPHALHGESSLRMMFRDTNTYLPDDILCKVDRAAMANSLETRVPFLDHRVAEIAWRLPLSMKIRGNQGKWALRQLLYKHVPKSLIERPKAGFGVPVGSWIKGPLRDWAEALLDEKRLAQEGYFYPAPIKKKWAEHLRGTHDHTHSLWAILMFQAWLEAQ